MLLPTSWAMGLSGKHSPRKRESLQFQDLLGGLQLESDQGPCSPFLLKMGIHECWGRKRSSKEKAGYVGERKERRRKEERIGRKDEWTDGWIDGWMEGGMEENINST